MTTDESDEVRIDVAALDRARSECDQAITRAESEAHENESLACERVNWGMAHCTEVEWFFAANVHGYRFGWRCYVTELTPRLCAYIADDLRNRGWQHIEVIKVEA